MLTGDSLRLAQVGRFAMRVSVQAGNHGADKPRITRVARQSLRPGPPIQSSSSSSSSSIREERGERSRTRTIHPSMVRGDAASGTDSWKNLGTFQTFRASRPGRRMTACPLTDSTFGPAAIPSPRAGCPSVYPAESRRSPEETNRIALLCVTGFRAASRVSLWNQCAPILDHL